MIRLLFQHFEQIFLKNFSHFPFFTITKSATDFFYQNSQKFNGLQERFMVKCNCSWRRIILPAKTVSTIRILNYMEGENHVNARRNQQSRRDPETA